MLFSGYTSLRSALPFCLGLSLLAAATLRADDQTTPKETTANNSGGEQRLRVGTRVSPPFAYQNMHGDWTGIAIDVWRLIALEQKLDYELVVFTSLPELLEAVPEGKIDVAIGGLTITSQREDFLDFSHPFIASSLGILSLEERGSPWLNVARRFFSWPFIATLGSLFLVLLISGALLYVFERRRNPEQFHPQALRGIGDALWWSAVTMTTVGYGDKAPVSLPGRIVALGWMFISVIMLSTFTASIVSALALETNDTSIRGIQDIKPGQVGTLAGSTSYDILEILNLEPQHGESMQDLIGQLKSRSIKAIVYDVPFLEYAIRNQPRGTFVITPLPDQRQDYGFAVRSGSPLRNTINLSLLDLIRDPRWSVIRQTYRSDDLVLPGH
jgi:polar amino acid transport system substrate-binding protein